MSLKADVLKEWIIFMKATKGKTQGKPLFADEKKEVKKITRNKILSYLLIA